MKQHLNLYYKYVVPTRVVNQKSFTYIYCKNSTQLNLPPAKSYVMKKCQYYAAVGPTLSCTSAELTYFPHSALTVPHISQDKRSGQSTSFLLLRSDLSHEDCLSLTNLRRPYYYTRLQIELQFKLLCIMFLQSLDIHILIGSDDQEWIEYKSNTKILI